MSKHVQNIEKLNYCSVSCPAIRDDKGTFWCKIKRACVAPFEHKQDYGFEIIRESKIVKSGYATDCPASSLFPQKEHNDQMGNDERMCTLNSLFKACECVPITGRSSEFDKGFHQAMTLVRGWIKRKVHHE